jgi:putative tricarboxylic transport membrane protein
MSNALKKDSWLSVFWIVCALLICFGAYRLSLGSLSDPGPGMFPFLAGAALCVLSIIECWNISRAYRNGAHMLAQTVGEGAPGARSASAETVEPLFVNRLGALKAAAIIVALLTYALTMEHLGFILSTTLFIAFLLWLVERQRWYVIVFGSVVSSLTTYLVFKVWLDTALPVGLFGF